MLTAIAAIVGVLAGAVLGWLLSQRASAAANEAQSQRQRDFEAQLAQSQADVKRLQALLDAEREQRAGAEGEIKRIASLRDQDMESLKAQRAQWEKDIERLKGEFKLLADATLKQVVAEHLTAASGEIEERRKAVEAMVKPLKEKLDEYQKAVQAIEVKREGAYVDVSHTLRQIRETEISLATEAKNLTTALRGQPTKWGVWGELQLRRILESTGMSKYCSDFKEQEKLRTAEGTLIPDVIVNLPNGRCIVVDSKAPVEALLQAVETDDIDAKQERLKQFGRAVVQHLKALSSTEYWRHVAGSPDFVIMFLPGESFYRAAIELEPQLLEFNPAQPVIVASPATLTAMLRAIANGWREKQLEENAHKLSSEARELYKRVRKFLEHFDNVGKELNKSMDAYNEAVASYRKMVLPQGRRVLELGVDEHGEFPELLPRDITTRQLILPEPAADEAPELLPDEAGQTC